jgi:myosin-5
MFKLGEPGTFHYLNQSNCYELNGVDDSKEYIATRRAMGVVGISAGDQVFHRKLVHLEDKNLQV